MGPLDLVQLTALMDRTSGRAEVSEPCPTCGTAPATNGMLAATPSYVYALGRIEPRFPRLSVEKELAQVTGRTDTAGLSARTTPSNKLCPATKKQPTDRNARVKDA